LKLQALEKSEQQKISENFTLKEIIDRLRKDTDKSKKQIESLEDKLDQKENQIIQLKHDSEEKQRRLKTLQQANQTPV
jgi:uncharacterized coiled-coil DUF342 family protein